MSFLSFLSIQRNPYSGIAFIVGLTLILSSCLGAPTTRLGKVKNNETGLMIGSTIEKSIITDASFHKNKKVKVRIRNTSGDVAFDLNNFQSQIENAYRDIGYEPTSEDDFGFLIDVNVKYSGHVQTNLSAEYGFLGGSAGGLAGARYGSTRTDIGIGIVSGATLGSIIGSFVTDDTYIIVSDVSYASVKDLRSKAGKTITFSRSTNMQEDKDEDQNESKRSIKKVIRTGVAVYAGGRNTPQSEISGMVRERIARIVGNII